LRDQPSLRDKVASDAFRQTQAVKHGLSQLKRGLAASGITENASGFSDGDAAWRMPNRRPPRRMTFD
jgi:DNA-binding protein H-NS